jgi:hypothetical protein
MALVASTVAMSVLGSSAQAYPSALLPNGGAFFGARVEPRGDESQRAALRRVESQIGRKFAIDHQYYQWGSRIPTAHQRWDVETGRIPFINWKAGSSWSSIANGSHDAWIRERADAFKEFSAPIYLAFHHEPENDHSRFGSASDYAAAFRRIVTVFRGRGVTNVAFVWTMMAWTFNPRSGRDSNAYYPGDGYVDFIGADGYNWYPGKSGTNWTSFQDVFTDVNSFALAHGKPWMVVEYGVQEDPAVPGRKAQWFRDTLTTAKSWPLLKAAIYYDVDKLYNWVTDTSSSSMNAYREIANDPWFRPGGGGSPPPPPGPTPSPTLPPPSPNPTPPPSGPVPPIVRNGLNEGPQGASVLPGRAGGKASPFDLVAITRGSTLTFDNTHARGAFSARHALTERADSYYEWSGRRRVWFGRIYVWLPSLPGADMRLVRAKAGEDLRASVNIRSSGRVGFQDIDNQWVKVSRAAIPLQRWVRLEWKIDHRNGTVRIKIFAKPNAKKPTEVIRAGPDLNIGRNAGRFQFGRSGSNDFAMTFWTDSPGLSTKGYLGPDSARRSG